MSLHLARKVIKDEDGVKLARMIKVNKHLRKIELEGNLLGPNTARELGEALLSNKTLKYLDLEGNQLQHD
jgi:Ran GTPase-activating protein (RanGAP) involved in mRNA processing and transport